MLLQPGSRPVPDSPDYRLIRKLGAGAFGEVWHAHGPGGLDVALKFIRLDSHVRALELRSLEVMRSIRHPNLVSLFGAWHKDNWLILAMELCDRSLQDRLTEALDQQLPGMPLNELLDCMRDAATGLDALNAKQVQHRDVKPANLLLLDSGVKVADFGLAKVLEQTVASNSGAGTTAYTAPECFKGKLTQQSDQYSLAVTYFHLRTGRLLFKGDQAQVMYAHLELEPGLSHLPPAEGVILARALSKEPGKRWRNCKEFVSELIRVHEHAKEEARQLQEKETERRRQEEERQKREAKAAERKRQEEDARKKAVGGGLQTLLDEGKEAGYLTYSQVSDYLSVRVFGIEPDGPVKVLPDDAVNQEKLHQLLVVLDQQDIALIDDTEAIDVDSDDALFYYNRGNAWFDKEEYGKAIDDYDYGALYPDDGIAWLEKRPYDKAMKALDEAIGNINRLIRFDLDVIRCFSEALLYCIRGKLWMAKKDYDKAIEDFGEAIRLDPGAIDDFDGSPLYYMRGRLWLVKKDYAKAIKDFDEAIRLHPEDSDTYDRMAWLFATCPEDKVRDGKRAIQLAVKACELTNWKNGSELNTLAAAYAEAGQFDEAVRYQTQAIEEPRGPAASDGYRERLELYKQKKPFREST